MVVQIGQTVVWRCTLDLNWNANVVSVLVVWSWWMCSAVSDEVVYHCHYELQWASTNPHTQNDVEYWIITWVRPSVNGLSLSSSLSCRFWQRWTETVTVANTSYDTNWNKPLTWCLAAAEGGDRSDGMGGETFRGFRGGLRLNLWSPADRPMLDHARPVLTKSEAKTLDNQL